MEIVKITTVYNCQSEEEAEHLIDRVKDENVGRVVEHATKYKSKKDRKTGEITEEIWQVTLTVKYDV